ncbi:MoxR family ATPase [Luteolibacter pohnpeiensis]|uniref:MoxR family ATPase n=1 Tax=Luteolibacter pohnpeiensis TaxID=454153 RepID=A0A934VVB3_9BACT|nr:MoxR family ATPase [Luteolibacter pohnpeiensis]MBK1881618.1 MoxR family ATPase [Luteolibacter pohnpeiensis]
MPDLPTPARLEQAVCSVVRGQEPVIRRILATMISGGHVLLEDYPGTGKTTMAKAIAAAISGSVFKRVQFTPDLLPSDILGISVLDPRSQEFRFHPGPIFTNILLADEINRASPRTQSALLEAMAEGQATIEGERHDFGSLFFVIATQNPVEFRGTYPLPEAQMDRFALQCTLGYVSAAEEVAILADQVQTHPVDQLEPVVSRDEILELMDAAKKIRFSEELRHYTVALVAATRSRPEVQLPASPRASLALMKVSQALALFEGLDFVSPEIIQSVAVDVIAHRLVLAPEAKYLGQNARQIVEDIIAQTPVPV